MLGSEMVVVGTNHIFVNIPIWIVLGFLWWKLLRLGR